MAHVTFEWRTAAARDFYAQWEFNLLAAVYGALPDDTSAAIVATDKCSEPNPQGFDFVCTIVFGHTEIEDYHLADIQRVLLYTCEGIGNFKFMITATDGGDIVRTITHSPATTVVN